MQYFSITTHAIKSTFLIAVVTLLAATALALPQAASAYSTTAQSAIQLTEDTFLFQVTYRFNFLNRAARVPILAQHATAVDTTLSQVQYSLRAADGEVITAGASTAIVLSDATVVDNQYYLPAGTAKLFTLFTIVQLPSDVLSINGEASLQIDRLPFTMIQDGLSTPARVPEADLLLYKTPFITW